MPVRAKWLCRKQDSPVLYSGAKLAKSQGGHSRNAGLLAFCMADHYRRRG